jgi:hypothetical protein
LNPAVKIKNLENENKILKNEYNALERIIGDYPINILSMISKYLN